MNASKYKLSFFFSSINNLFLLIPFNTIRLTKVTPNGLSFLTSVSKRRHI